MLLAVVAAVGCATSPETEGPDLEPAKQDTEQRIQSLDAAESSIRRDLGQLQQLKQDLLELAGRVDDELPFSLMRLVAMNCINTEYASRASRVVTVGGMPLTCRPAHIDELQSKLDEYPTAAQDTAYQLLYVVDQARLLRGQLRTRLATLPGAVNDHYEYMADERAMLRQLEADLEQQRNVYGTRQWRRVNERVEEYRELLGELDERIGRMVDDYPQWPQQVDELITAIYFELAELRVQK